MSEQPATYGEWLAQMKDFKGGWLGGLVITLTIIITPFLGFYGINIFPPGTYPRMVLAIPGLILAALVFLLISAMLWPLKKPR